jgi:hypothetical protein
MSKFKLIGAGLVLTALSAAANAAIITEAYTGSQVLAENQSYYFAFDMWYGNEFPVLDTSPGLRLTTDGYGAFGNWSSATLYVDFFSTDSDREYADIDFSAWGDAGFLNLPESSTTVLSVDSFRIPVTNGTFTYSHSFDASALNILDNEGWGAARIGASFRTGLANDFGISRVALIVNNGPRGGTNVAEPASLAMFGAGLLGLAFVTRRRFLVKN